MKWVVMVLALMAGPAVAQDCFSGEPRQVSYNNGRVFTIIQRHGADVTYTVPYEGFQDSVTKSHLMLIPKQNRAGARSTEYRWTSRLPKLADMVPGFSFDLKGTIKSGDREALPYRISGSVTGQEEVMVGACPYVALVIATETFLGDTLIFRSTDHLSPDMGVLLKSDTLLIETGQEIRSEAVALN